MIKEYKNRLFYDDGRIYSLNYKRFLNPPIDITGYRRIKVDGKTVRVHRIFAELFLLNLNSLPCVNHIDGNKLNNSIDNLEWCNYKENFDHAIKTGLYPIKKIIQMDKQNNIVSYFKSASEAEIKTGVSAKCIYRVCNGDRITSGGFKWACYYD